MLFYYDNGLFAGLVILAVILAVIGIILYDAFWLTKNLFSKTERVTAIVVRMHGLNCFVTFHFEGRDAEFAVPEAVYAEIDEGDEGLLTFRGEQFKRFVRADKLTGGDFVG